MNKKVGELKKMPDTTGWFLKMLGCCPSEYHLLFHIIQHT